MAENEKSIFDVIETKIKQSRLPKEEKQAMLERFKKMREQKTNIMITGATGCGKSSTINALFGKEVAEVGCGVDPETQIATSYEIGNITLWDNPGLGDSVEADKINAEAIKDMLQKTNPDGTFLIDLVLVVINGANKDMGTSYKLINEVVIPNLGAGCANRILVAINLADVAMGGRHWNYEKNQPDKTLFEFLTQKAESVKGRILEATGVVTEPMFYAAGFKEEGKPQEAPYNIDKLTRYIVQSIPEDKRYSLISSMPTEEGKSNASTSLSQMMKDLDEMLKNM